MSVFLRISNFISFLFVCLFPLFVGKKRSSLSLFLSLFFDGFALPSSYHHHPTAFKCYDLMTVLHLFGSIVDSLRRRE